MYSWRNFVPCSQNNDDRDDVKVGTTTYTVVEWQSNLTHDLSCTLIIGHLRV
jgi:hypothetical protein